MISIYSSAFNIVKLRFDYSESLKTFCNFGDEVIIAVNSSVDNTLEALSQWKLDNGASHLKIIKTDFSYEDPLLDGKIKNAALKATTLPCKSGFDLDERPVLRLKNRWVEKFKELQKSPYKALLIPSLDLYGDIGFIRPEKQNILKFK